MSAMHCMRLCECQYPRSQTTPIRFFMPMVSWDELWCLRMGTLMNTSAWSSSSWTLARNSTSPLGRSTDW